MKLERPFYFERQTLQTKSSQPRHAMMTPEERQELDEKLRDMSVEQLEAYKTRFHHGTEWRNDVEKTLKERRASERAAADAPTQQRFERTFEQAERHHKASKRWACIGAAVSLLGAIASWAGVYFSHLQAQRVQQQAVTPAAATPMPTAINQAR